MTSYASVSGEIDAASRALLDGAYTSLVDSEHSSSSDMRLRFVSNDYRVGRKVLSLLEYELERCVSFDFSVAFVTMGGIVPLLPALEALERKGVPGRILTTDYLTFSEPRALEKLASFSNIEVRMFPAESGKVGFHTKGYLFDRSDGSCRALVGSSNLTGSAITTNHEWNLRLVSSSDGELLKDLRAEFSWLWSQADDISRMLAAYKALYAERKRIIARQKAPSIAQARLKPNEMQVSFIANLDQLIEQGAKRALLISATGTGKTYASAFAVRHLAPHRMLFLAHREQILRQSIRSYENVFGDTKSMGLFSGHEHAVDRDFVFATMQTMSKVEYLQEFDPQAFDMVVVDEVHRAGSAGYGRILEHFAPKFCLGMTASPERTDGFDIYGLFDHNIAYEIRLQQALALDLLCPFHYFGVTDIAVNGEVIDEDAAFSRLTSDERVAHIIKEADRYGYSGNRVKGLMFCRSIDEAKELSLKLNEHGWKTIALTGSDSPEQREHAIARLSANPGDKEFEDRLDYILTVDIFNEGVDVPAINQIIMLRPTESPIIFVQQLGRGLRKAPENEDKEFTVVIDFIGNYSNNFMIPIALSGDRSYQKDAIRKYVFGGSSIIPGQSTIHFDEISRRRIFDSIDRSSVDMRLLKEKYISLKNRLGRIPRLLDFYEHGEIDPMLFIEKKRSYYRFLDGVERGSAFGLNESEQMLIEFLSQFVAKGMRPHELVILRLLERDGETSFDGVAEEFSSLGLEPPSAVDVRSALRVLDLSFVNAPGDRKRYADVSILSWDEGGSIKATDTLSRMLCGEPFRSALSDIVDFGLRRFRDRYAKDPAKMDAPFTLYEKYTRKDACRLLDWEHDDSSTMYGYRVKHGTCPIFVTYNKAEDISSSTRYDDVFEGRDMFSWMTRSRLKLDSPEVVKIREASKSGLDVRLFVKRSDSEGSDFWYMGRVDPVQWKQQEIMADSGETLPIVNFKLHLRHPVQDDVYAYFAEAM